MRQYIHDLGKYFANLPFYQQLLLQYIPFIALVVLTLYILYRKRIPKEKIKDFVVLCLRWYLAFYMIDYGWSKMTGGQFGVKPEMLDKPLKDVPVFYLAWYLFSKSQVFNIVVGLSQIIGGILIVINRTVLLGALMLLPVLVQIMLIDVAFTTEAFGPNLALRLLAMILSDLGILFYYRKRMIAAVRILTDGISTKFKYRWWVYLLLPIIGFLTDFIFGFADLPIRLLLLKWMRGQ